MPLQPRVTEVEQLLFCSDVAAIGMFRCPSRHRLYKESEPMSGHALVFPRTSTTIVYAGGGALTAAPPTVLFYNRGQEYLRRVIDPIDSCDWFMIAPDIAREIVLRFDPSAGDRDSIFNFFSAPASERLYLAQRQLVSSLRNGASIDALQVEETVLQIAESAVREAFTRRFDTRESIDVEKVKAAIAANPAASQSLRSLATLAGCSPFQLCRAFRRSTGRTITAYRHALRLRVALDALRDSRSGLTDIALDLGYACHSHFTKFFRRHFGMTPSAYRADQLRLRT